MTYFGDRDEKLPNSISMHAPGLSHKMCELLRINVIRNCAQYNYGIGIFLFDQPVDSCNVASATLLNFPPFDGRRFAAEDVACAINAYYAADVVGATCASSLWASSGGIYN